MSGSLADATDDELVEACRGRARIHEEQIAQVVDDSITNLQIIEVLCGEVLRLRRASRTSDADRAVAAFTHSGGGIHVLDPRPGEVRIEDVARGLATHFRYNGQTSEPYTVAEHSLLVAAFVPEEFRLQALLHDATEAYLGDVVRPIKSLPAMAGYRDAERRLEDAIFAELGVRRTPESDEAIRMVDDRILVDEAAALVVPDAINDRASTEKMRARYGEPLGCSFACLGIMDAESAFLDAFRRLAHVHS